MGEDCYIAALRSTCRWPQFPCRRKNITVTPAHPVKIGDYSIAPSHPDMTDAHLLAELISHAAARDPD
ncbi:hypothetical protein, partial [Accumulibacter sp.]|uniref:hypothetical protein n=1 Tax=Accumulibacter sp. TaxID=2053492 RepID=UPI0026370F2B